MTPINYSRPHYRAPEPSVSLPAERTQARRFQDPKPCERRADPFSNSDRVSFRRRAGASQANLHDVQNTLRGSLYHRPGEKVGASSNSRAAVFEWLNNFFSGLFVLVLIGVGLFGYVVLS